MYITTQNGLFWWRQTEFSIAFILSVSSRRRNGKKGTAIVHHFAGFEVFGEHYGTLDSRSQRSSDIIAPWVGVNECNARPGVVRYYLKQNGFLDGEWRTLILARVDWFQEHPKRHMHQGGTTEICCKDIFEPLGLASFIPVQRISCKFVGTVQKWKGEKVLFVLPLERWHYRASEWHYRDMAQGHLWTIRSSLIYSCSKDFEQICWNCAKEEGGKSFLCFATRKEHALVITFLYY